LFGPVAKTANAEFDDPAISSIEVVHFAGNSIYYKISGLQFNTNVYNTLTSVTAEHNTLKTRAR